MSDLQEIINRNRAWYCLECGKCSAVCPITLWEKRTYCSPRLLIEKALNRGSDNVYEDPLFWSCLTCKRMMTDPDLDQNRLEWLDGDLRISPDSEVLYFVGCLPYYQVQFKEMGIEGLAIARAAVRILNHLGIAPQVLSDERCCGHDQIWQGDRVTFDALARLNLERIKATQAKQIITTCPECARTLGLDYPKQVGEHGMEVLHLSQFISRHPAAATLDWNSQKMKSSATYQDACRLSRHLGVYEEPRALLHASGLELVEMERTRRSSLCCGTSCWTACGQVSKNIQVERLKEARATGAELLITTCIKCQIHFKCAQQDHALEKDIDIPIRDLTTVLADRL
jgi:Fe-S oxidoreductase